MEECRGAYQKEGFEVSYTFNSSEKTVRLSSKCEGWGEGHRVNLALCLKNKMFQSLGS